MKSRAKSGQSGPRYRVNYDARDKDGNPIKRVMRLTLSRRGVRARVIAAATVERQRLERETMALQNWGGRYEEHEALRILKKVPSVREIAVAIAAKIRESASDAPGVAEHSVRRHLARAGRVQ